jgi:hypothetical protein
MIAFGPPHWSTRPGDSSARSDMRLRNLGTFIEILGCGANHDAAADSACTRQFVGLTATKLAQLPIWVVEMICMTNTCAKRY